MGDRTKAYYFITPNNDIRPVRKLRTLSRHLGIDHAELLRVMKSELPVIQGWRYIGDYKDARH
ncbi:MAG: hypothetical protein ACRDCE_17965 [Cetobacterium sp.]|uniref:hypothetical protein n=1 Tax=Cetobacterium sp. TaxID=2071632 RepID=UPI003EE7F71E